MHPQLMHLLGELDLQIGVQSQPEQSFGCGTCSIDVAAVDRHPQRGNLALLHRLLIGRRQRVDNCQGLFVFAPLFIKLGQFKLHVNVVIERIGGWREDSQSLVFFIHPPVKVSQSKLPEDFLSIGCIGITQLFLEVVNQIAGRIRLFVDRECLIQHLNR